MHYGNNASVDLWYKSAAILIRIPRWSRYRQKLIATSTGEYCGVTETDDDGMVKGFEDIFQDHECIVQEETQKLNDQFKELMDNKSINEVKGLVDMLKELQMKLNSHTYLSDHDIYRIKDDLESLRYQAYYSVEDFRIQHLRNTLETLRRKYRWL